MKPIAGICLLMLISGCVSNQRDRAVIPPEPRAVQNAFSFQVFSVESGFGYDIFRDDTRLIHQPHIPALSGIHPFADSLHASRVAQLMCNKLKAGEWPPSLSQKEVLSQK